MVRRDLELADIAARRLGERHLLTEFGHPRHRERAAGECEGEADKRAGKRQRPPVSDAGQHENNLSITAS
jgi:hypothetical protein